MNFIKPQNYDVAFDVDKFPSQCPFCNCTADFSAHCSNSRKYNFLEDDIWYNMLDLYFCCPSRYCRREFLWTYEEMLFEQDQYRLIYESEKFINKSSFPGTIVNVSSRFVKIYNQALIAESNNLDEIVGLGYRKAFEFLIKDYIISGLTDETIIDSVKKQFRIQILIEKYFENNGHIKQLSSRISWLGNDEAHYVRKHTSHDVSDIKTLIHLLCNHIDTDITTRRYIEEIKPK